MFGFVSIFLQIFLAVSSLILIYFQWSHQHWRRRNIPYLPPKIPFGNISNPFTDQNGTGPKLHQIYNEMKRRKWKIGGIFFFTSPVIVVIDPKHVRSILSGDNHHFSDRGLFHNEKADPLSPFLSAVSGSRWKNLKKMFQAVSTSANLEVFFEILAKNRFEKLALEKTVNIEEFVKVFAVDFFGDCVFGEDYARIKRKFPPFEAYTKEFITPTRLDALKVIFGMHFPKLARFFRVKAISADVTKSFLKAVSDVITQRGDAEPKRLDCTQIFLNMKTEINCFKITDFDIALQTFLFFVPQGNLEGSCRTSCALYELAKNEAMQTKLRLEITTFLEKCGKITYKSIQTLKYLDQVVKETLRMYPSLSILTRKCVRDYKIEDVTIETGSLVMVSVLGLHYDEEHFPDPNTFNPERFSDEKMGFKNQNTYLPFGLGPRSCSGMHLGLMIMKFCLVSFLSNYKFTVGKKSENGLKVQAFSSTMFTNEGIWLNVTKIEV